jgi:hypothetical protein
VRLIKAIEIRPDRFLALSDFIAFADEFLPKIVGDDGAASADPRHHSHI